MNAPLSTQLAIAAFVCSLAALFISLLAAFPNLKTVLTAIRDGVLWCALCLVLGGAAFLVWQQVQRQPLPAVAASKTSLHGAALHAGSPPLPSAVQP